ncbi:MAG: phosphoribosyltransferase [Micrococcales bacterium]|nr:phosphoribosyltransferase [Micrococcales bacterium]
MAAVPPDSSARPDKEVLSWERFGNACRELALQVKDSSFEPEVLIAVARGGLLPGGALSYALGVKLADAINVEFYTDVHETLPDPVLLAPMLDTDSIRDKRVLVVDDVVDSGRTLALVLDILARHGAQARSAVIYAKPTTVIEPDFAWAHTDRWIVFPWSAQPPIAAN